MEIKASVLKTEVEALNAAPQFNVAHTWSAVIHLPTGDVEPLYVHWVKCYSNYTNRFSDEMVIALSVPAGTFDFDVYKHKDDLEITLTKTITQVNAQELIKSTSTEPVTQRYRAKLMSLNNDSMSQNLPGANDKKRLDSTQTRDVKFQLIHPLADYMRKMSSGGVFTDERGIDCVRAFLGAMSRQAAKVVGVNFKGVDVASGYSEKLCEVILVEDHTPLIEIPKAINDDAGGIYPTSFWTYLSGEYWYVYPKLDVQRYYAHTGNRLRVINVPENRLPESPKTFMIKDRLITVLATGQVKQMDLSDVEQETKGNGVRYSDPDKLFNNYTKSSGGKVVADASQSLTEVSVGQRADKTNYVTLSNTPITSRHNIEYSKLAARRGMLVQFTWESAAPELIYPGMPCSYVYLRNELEAVELSGVVASVEWHSTTTQLDTKNRTFQRKAAVQMYVGDGAEDAIVTHGNTGKGSSTISESDVK